MGILSKVIGFVFKGLPKYIFEKGSEFIKGKKNQIIQAPQIDYDTIRKLTQAEVDKVTQWNKSIFEFKSLEFKSTNASWLQRNTRPLGVWVCFALLVCDSFAYTTSPDWVQAGCLAIIGGYYGFRTIDKFSTK